MPMPKIDEVRSLSDQELAEEILTVKKELFELRLQKATRQLNQPHLIRQRKHKLAQLLTVETERQQGINTDVAILTEDESESSSDQIPSPPTETLEETED